MATRAREKIEKLKSLMTDLEERRQNLILFDGTDEINSHCDDLIGQVTLTVESAMDHLNKVQDRMINEVNEYRKQLLDAQDKSENDQAQSPAEKGLRNLSAKIEMIKSNKLPHDEALELAKGLLEKANKLRKKMRAETFGGEFLRFFDQDFDDDDIIGRLEKTKRDIQDDFAIKHLVLDEMVPSAQVFNLVSSKKGSSTLNAVTAILHMRDGNLAVGAGFKYPSILVWDTKTNKKRLQLNLKYECFEFTTALAQLPSGHLVSGSSQGKIEIWDLEDQDSMDDIGDSDEPILWLKALPDGRLIAFGRDIRVWDLSDLDDIPSSPTFRFQAQVEQESYNQLHEIDAWNTLKLEREEEEDRCYLSKEIDLYFEDCDEYDPDYNLELRVHMEMLWDGTLAYSYILPAGPKVTIWDPDTDESIKVVDFEAEDAKSCTVLPNGDVVICRADDRVEIYSLEDEKMHTTFKNDKGPIVAIRMQSENSLVFVHLEDPRLPILGNEKRHYEVSTTCLSDDGKRLAVGTNHERLVMWPIRN